MRCLDNELEKNMDKLSIGAKTLTNIETHIQTNSQKDGVAVM